MASFALFVFSAHFVCASALREMINHNMPDMTSNNLDRHKKKVLEGKTVLDFFFVIIIILLQQSREIHFPIWRCVQTPLLKLEVISLHHPRLGLLQSQNNSLRPLPSPPIILFIHIHLYPSLPQTFQSHSIDPSSWMKQQSTALLSLFITSGVHRAECGFLIFPRTKCAFFVQAHWII